MRLCGFAHAIKKGLEPRLVLYCAVCVQRSIRSAVGAALAAFLQHWQYMRNESVLDLRGRSLIYPHRARYICIYSTYCTARIAVETLALHARSMIFTGFSQTVPCSLERQCTNILLVNSVEECCSQADTLTFRISVDAELCQNCFSKQYA